MSLTPTFRINGYSIYEPEEITSNISNGTDISTISGDFVVSKSSPSHQLLASSFLSSIPYYYAFDKNGSLIHGNNVFELARRSGKEWKWNERALQCLALYGHTLNDDTLCAGIYRIPSATQISVSNGKTKIEELQVKPFEWDKEINIENSFEQLKLAFEKCVTDSKPIYLSLSAGYDSRLLLALCLDAGIVPIISVMGNEECTDVVVASSICKDLGLPLNIVNLSESDYIKYGNEIANITSGVKTANNWHTYLYGKRGDFNHGTHLVGSNGEFARSFFFDIPKLNGIADRSPRVVMNAYWLARLFRRARKFSKLNPLVNKSTITTLELSTLAKIGHKWNSHNFRSELDAFYAEQRVRHFIGAGLACYSSYSSPRSPFLDPNWIRSIAGLRRHLKCGNLFHYDSTKKLNAGLTKRNYNLLSNGQVGTSYSPFEKLANSNATKELLVDSPYLSEWMSRKELVSILDDQNCSQMEERAFWMTLHFASEACSATNRAMS
jgi:hypothetical protein